MTNPSQDDVAKVREIPYPPQDDKQYGKSTMYWIELIEVSLLNGNVAAAKNVIKRYYDFAYNRNAAPEMEGEQG